MDRPGRHRIFFALVLIAGCVIAGCAKPFPKATLERVDRSVSFPELLKNPDNFKGRWLMLAGVIVASKNTKDGAMIEVLQKPMDGDGRPLRTDKTEGRFIVQSDQYLDTAIYRSGRHLTVIGEVAGRKELPLDEVMYQYPLLIMRDLHLWEPRSGPQFHFGIGVFHSF